MAKRAFGWGPCATAKIESILGNGKLPFFLLEPQVLRRALVSTAIVMSTFCRRTFLQRMTAVGAGAFFIGGRSPESALLTAPGAGSRPQWGREVPDDIAPIDAPFDMPDLGRPTFPERTFDIREYGATEGGAVKNTEAIAKAIEACHQSGGGEVRIPEGEWLTGPIHLRSNVNLRVADGARVRFSADRADYLPVVHTRIEGVEVYNYSPLIYAPNCRNVAITGAGTLDGNGAHWWEYFRTHHDEYSRIEDAKRPLSERRYGTGRRGLRPSFIQPWQSRNVLVEGVTITNTPMWTVHPVYCQNVVVRDVHIQTLDAPNGDGVNPDSCRNVLVEYCTFETGDDAVPIKSGLNEDGRRVGVPSENVAVRHIDARDVRTGSGGVVIGSETSGDIRNVYVHNCRFEGTDRGLRLKSERGRGGVVENLYVRDVEMRAVSNQAININSFYSGGEATGPAPLFRNIDIRNVRIDGAAVGIDLVGLPEEWIRNVRLRNIQIRADEGVRCTRVDGLTMTEGAVETEGQAVALSNCSDVTLRWLTLSGTGSLLTVRGSDTADVRVDESLSTEDLDVGTEVAENAVVHVD